MHACAKGILKETLLSGVLAVALIALLRRILIGRLLIVCSVRVCLIAALLISLALLIALVCLITLVGLIALIAVRVSLIAVAVRYASVLSLVGGAELVELHLCKELKVLFRLCVAVDKLSEAVKNKHGQPCYEYPDSRNNKRAYNCRCDLSPRQYHAV